MPKIYFSKDQVDTAIEALEDYIAMVTRQHKEHGLMRYLNGTINGVITLREVFQNASQDHSTKQS